MVLTTIYICYNNTDVISEIGEQDDIEMLL